MNLHEIVIANQCQACGNALVNGRCYRCNPKPMNTDGITPNVNPLTAGFAFDVENRNGPAYRQVAQDHYGYGTDEPFVNFQYGGRRYPVNLRLTNMCESGEHDRCIAYSPIDMLIPRPYTCRCLCHTPELSSEIRKAIRQLDAEDRTNDGQVIGQTWMERGS